MAVVQSFNQDNDNQDQQNNQQSFTPVSVAGSSQGPAAPSAPSAAPTIQNAPTSSGRYTNLKSYLDANKGFNQGQGLAGKIASNIEGQAQGVRQGLQQQTQQHQGDLEKNRVTFDPNVSSQLQSNPTQVDKSSFQRMLAGQYSGPSTPQAFADLQSQASQVQSLANLGSTEPGRYALLQKLYGGSGYAKGQQSLDNLLLQVDPNQLNRLSSTAQQVAPLAQSVVQQRDALNTLRNQYAQEAQQTSQQAKQALGSALTGFDTEAQQQAKQMSEAEKLRFAQLKNPFQTGNVSEELAKQYGADITQSTYGIDPSQYLSQNLQALNATNALSQDQLAKIQALSSLAGNYLSGPESALLSKYSGASAYNPGEISNFDINAYKQAVAAQKAKADEDIARAYFNIANTQAGAGEFASQNSLSQRNIAENLRLLKEYVDRAPDSRNIKTGEVVQGRALRNPYATNIGYKNAVDELSKIMSKYNIDPTTGTARGLTVGSAPSAASTVPYNTMPKTLREKFLENKANIPRTGEGSVY